MIIYPAIDLRQGKVVRLQEGDAARQTIFSDDPLRTAADWIDQGAQWLHMVNLDGAFRQANDNGAILERVAGLGTPVQFGGGLRYIDDIADAFDRGATRVVLGTIAIQQPQIIEQAINRWGVDAICIALDARDGKITTHGWQQASSLTPVDFGRQIEAAGARHALFTDVSRDGLLSGVNIDATAELARETGLSVIASGGVRGLADVQQLAAARNIAGVVIGMALYAGHLTLADALKAAEE